MAVEFGEALSRTSHEVAGGTYRWAACRFRAVTWLAVVMVATLLVQGVLSHAEPALPDAKEVMARVLRRASALAKESDGQKYLYLKQTRTEELNSRGETIRSTEKIYRVIQIQGWSFARLVKVQGRDLSPAELQQQDEKERAFRAKITGRDPQKSREGQAPWLSPEIVARYEFTVLSNEVHQARTMLVVGFQPKLTNPEKSIQDRLFNRIAGRLWVDSEDAEVARLEVGLVEEFSLGWLGALGSLKHCDLHLERLRLPDGTWVDQQQTLLLVGRKLLNTMRLRNTEECRDFVRSPQ
jgi:hypothetical protein